MGTHTTFSCGWEGRDRWAEMGKTDSGLRVGLELAVLARQLLPDRLHFFFFFQEKFSQLLRVTGEAVGSMWKAPG